MSSAFSTQARLDLLFTTLGVAGSLLVVGAALAAVEASEPALLLPAAYGLVLVRLANEARRCTWGVRPLLLMWILPLVPLALWAWPVLLSRGARDHWHRRAPGPGVRVRAVFVFTKRLAAATAGVVAIAWFIAGTA